MLIGFVCCVCCVVVVHRITHIQTHTYCKSTVLPYIKINIRNKSKKHVRQAQRAREQAFSPLCERARARARERSHSHEKWSPNGCGPLCSSVVYWVLQQQVNTKLVRFICEPHTQRSKANVRVLVASAVSASRGCPDRRCLYISVSRARRVVAAAAAADSWNQIDVYMRISTWISNIYTNN